MVGCPIDLESEITIHDLAYLLLAAVWLSDQLSAFTCEEDLRGQDIRDQRKMIHRRDRADLSRLVINDDKRGAFRRDEVVFHLVANRLAGHALPLLR